MNISEKPNAPGSVGFAWDRKDHKFPAMLLWKNSKIRHPFKVVKIGLDGSLETGVYRNFERCEPRETHWNLMRWVQLFTSTATDEMEILNTKIYEIYKEQGFIK